MILHLLLLLACPSQDPEVVACQLACDQDWADCQETCLDAACLATCDAAWVSCLDTCEPSERE